MSIGSRESSGLAEADHRWLARPSRRLPLVVARGRAASLIDVDGREVIDLTSGWNVVNTGWNHPRVNAAVARQLDVNAFAPPWCSHPGRVRHAQRLAEWAPGEWVVWCGSGGSEAVEAALKIARRATGRHGVVGFEHAYHGGTLGSMLAGGAPGVSGVYLPLDDVHRHVPVPDLLRAPASHYAKLVSEAITAELPPAAILLEPIFTNPGVLAGSPDFYSAVARAARTSGTLVIADEIGTGFGRTGCRFGFEHTSLEPDMIVLGKAITSGAVPMSAVLMRPDLANAVSGAGFSATFGWTPPACAAAEATLSVIDDEQLVERAAALGARALEILTPLTQECSHVAAVRGWGLEIGVEIVGGGGRPVPWSTIAGLSERLLDRGVFAEPSSFTSTLLIMPPLVIPERQLEFALAIVSEETRKLTID